MRGYEPETYGQRIADVYDELYEEAFDKARAASFLVERAAGGPVLELAIGTGRMALPLVEAGIEVHGINISEAMVERLRGRPRGDEIRVHMGDFADVEVEGRFPLIYLVFNTLFALTTQEDQIRCFENVAKHLTDDGVFVIECFVPDVTRYERHQNTEVVDVEIDEVMLDVSRHDPVTQTVKSQHVFLGKSGTRLYPVFLRYAYPPELDVMARVAGLALQERYADWNLSPFTSDSQKHLSVYRRF
jgi:SAM-dependent methyltransferase